MFVVLPINVLFLHLVHVMRYMSCDDMLEKEWHTEYVVPVLVLLEVGLVLRCVHVVHLGFRLALMPVAAG